ncbi:EFM7 [Candida oxycetoniae]|uniref:Protein N-terminal and lysine N-methyltransferase EFM7 n=1 Tax=Candida oxycetoniae TaxID=497107 RepID=A0AAI9T0M1_9ASCO|nr:EFM7 [Candida oxycetoniae]KAI3406016.2 EFM7 [Candida oxycetoniae]
MSDEEVLLEDFLFEEPNGFLPPPPESHFATYKRKLANVQPQEITMKLVGKSPLWGHLLWNAGIFTADYLDKNSEKLVKDKRVLELGAAAALPSLVCAVNKAKEVVATDYPDADLVNHIKHNFDQLSQKTEISKYKVKGYIWGNSINELIYNDKDDDDDDDDNKNEANLELTDDKKFDLIILSDLVFNHTEHHKLLSTCRQCLKSNGKCLVVFSPHRAHLLNQDLAFFETCKEYQFKAEMIGMINMTPMFEEDEKTAEIRSRVYSYFLIPNW